MPDAKAVVVAVYPYKPYLDDFPQEQAHTRPIIWNIPAEERPPYSFQRLLQRKATDAVVNPPLPLKAAAYRADWAGLAGTGLYIRGNMVHGWP